MAYDAIFTDEISSLQAGMSIGDLQIISFLGKGAIGEVYLVQNDTLDQTFALKVIPKGFSNQSDGALTLKTAEEIQAKLKHPNIIRIDALGDEGMFYWLRMEYLKGEPTGNQKTLRSLQDLMNLTKGPLTVEEVRYYLFHILVGLGFAHSQGVIHGDLKPDNILLADDAVKISELGVVELIGHAWDDFHLLRQNPRLEPTPFDPLPGFSRQLPALLTTYEYYSPEQKTGQKPTISSNLYTVGLIAYRMLMGYLAINFELPSTTIANLDCAWDNWLKKALAHDPSKRFTSALTMLEAIPGLEPANS
jgi:serine/threonine protein kinase